MSFSPYIDIDTYQPSPDIILKKHLSIADSTNFRRDLKFEFEGKTENMWVEYHNVITFSEDSREMVKHAVSSIASNIFDERPWLEHITLAKSSVILADRPEMMASELRVRTYYSTLEILLLRKKKPHLFI